MECMLPWMPAVLPVLPSLMAVAMSHWLPSHVMCQTSTTPHASAGHHTPFVETVRACQDVMCVVASYQMSMVPELSRFSSQVCCQYDGHEHGCLTLAAVAY